MAERRAPGRRAFVGGTVSLAVVGCAGGAKKFQSKAVSTTNGVVTLEISDYPPLAAPGGMVAVQPAGFKKPVLVMRHEGDEFVVFSLRCTHLGCTVRWDDEQLNLVCPCHGSRFDDDGQPIKGPAKAALRRLKAEYREMAVHFEAEENGQTEPG